MDCSNHERHDPDIDVGLKSGWSNACGFLISRQLQTRSWLEQQLYNDLARKSRPH